MERDRERASPDAAPPRAAPAPGGVPAAGGDARRRRHRRGPAGRRIVGHGVGRGRGPRCPARDAAARTTTAAAPAPPADGAQPFSIAAVGDTVMGSLPYGLPSDGGASLFYQVDHLFTGDIVLGNLEGTLSSAAGPSAAPAAPTATPSDAAVLRALAGGGRVHRDEPGQQPRLRFRASGQRQTVAALTRVGHPQHRPPRHAGDRDCEGPARRDPRVRPLQVGRLAPRHRRARNGGCSRRPAPPRS